MQAASVMGFQTFHWVYLPSFNVLLVFPMSEVWPYYQDISRVSGYLRCCIDVSILVSWQHWLSVVMFVDCAQVYWASRLRSCCLGTPVVRLAQRSPCLTTSALWSQRKSPFPPHPFLSKRGLSLRCPLCLREHLCRLHEQVRWSGSYTLCFNF